MLAAARTCTAVQGRVYDGRRTALSPDDEALPCINLRMGDTDARLEIGAGVCTHVSQVNFEIFLRADDVPGTVETQAMQPSLRDLADPIRLELHRILFAAFPFTSDVTGLRQGGTSRPEAGDEDAIYQETCSYSVQFETQEADLSLSPR